jgi:excisionase family DNA binding protein
MSNENMSDKLIPLDAVAEMLSVTKRTVYRLIQRGDLPRAVKVGHGVRLYVSDVLSFFERLKLQRGEA